MILTTRFTLKLYPFDVFALRRRAGIGEDGEDVVHLIAVTNDMSAELDSLVAKACKTGRNEGAARTRTVTLAALNDLRKQAAADKPELVAGIEAAMESVRQITVVDFDPTDFGLEDGDLDGGDE